MIIEAGNFINLPVVSQEGQFLGRIEKSVFDSNEPHLIGFLIKTPGLLGKHQAISARDIIAYYRKLILLNSADSLVDTTEIIRLDQELKKQIKIIGADALTESGKKLGKVEDVLIDTETEAVLKYYLNSIFGKRIIGSDKVVEIKKEGIIFTDDEETKLASQEAAMV